MNKFYHWWHVDIKKRKTICFLMDSAISICSDDDDNAKIFDTAAQLYEFQETINVIAKHFNSTGTALWFYYEDKP